jgi:protein-tyrosine phosphatase
MTSAITEVSVEAEPGGPTTVEWTVEGPDVAVDVAVGPSPEGVDHQHSVTVPAGTTIHTLGELGPGRHFVSVAPAGGGPAVVGADRRIGFEGISNFRDLGGYRTASGGRTRWGQLYRADALHGLTASDLELYGELGIRLVVDLRSDMERDELPNPMASESLPLVFRREGSTENILSGETQEEGERVLARLYLTHLELGAQRIGEILRAMAGPDGMPAVFHCHAGKDRTGIIAALLLEAVGVDRATVLDDYELTARYRARAHQEGTFRSLVERGLPPEAAAGVLTTPRWAMADALDALDSTYAGIEAYLTGPAGLTPEELALLRTRLTTA